MATATLLLNKISSTFIFKIPGVKNNDYGED